MEVSTCRNNFLFYDPKAAERDAANILSGSEWDVLDDKEISKVHKSSKALRARVCEVIYKAESFFGLSLEALRASRDFNPKLSIILQSKRISHALNLEGNVRSPEGSMVQLNGFYDTFTIPMLGTSLLKWASKNPKEQEKAYAVVSLLTNSLFYDHVDEESCKKALKDLEQGLPVLIGSGFDWHSTFSILVQGEDKDHYYLISSNRGKDSKRGKSISGWNIYKIGKIAPAFIKRLASSINHTESDYLSCQKLIEEYGAKLIYQYPMKEQKVGNCSYTSLKAALSSLMMIWEITGGFKYRVSDTLFLKNAENDSYKLFSWADKHYVLEDFLIDLQENKEDNHVKPLAEMLHKKLIESPSLGFKIGWKLWLEVIEFSQKAFPNLTPINQDLCEQARQFIAEDMTNSSEETLKRLVQLIVTLLDKGEHQQVASCFNFLKSFVNKGKGFSEAIEVFSKLLSAKKLPLAMDLLIILIKNGEGCEKELTLCKQAMIEISKEEDALSNEVQDSFLKLMESLMILGKIEVLNQWLKDPEMENFLRTHIHFLFEDVSKKNNFVLAKQLIPLLNEDLLNSYAIEEFAIKLVGEDCIEEAINLSAHLKGSKKESVIQRILLKYISKKSFQEAFSIIKSMEMGYYKLSLIQDLHKAFVDEELWDNARSVRQEINELGDTYGYNNALSYCGYKQVTLNMWSEAKITKEELIKLKYPFSLFSLLRNYSIDLSRKKRFKEALEVAEFIEDCEEKAKVLEKLSIYLEKAGEIEQAQWVKERFNQMQIRIEEAEKTKFSF